MTRDVPALRHEIMSAELAAVPELAGYTVDIYRSSQPSDAARYAGYLDSTSSHLALSPDRRTALREALAAAIEEAAPDGFEVPICDRRPPREPGLTAGPGDRRVDGQCGQRGHPG
jgi:hypothetical protein